MASAARIGFSKVLALALLGLSLLCVVLLAATPASASRIWDSPEPFVASDYEGPAWYPEVTYTSEGELLARWMTDRRPGVGESEYKLAARTPEGDFGPSDSFVSTEGLKVIPDQVGGAFLSYTDTAGRMQVARRPPGGPVGPAERLDLHAADAPWVATNARGDAAAVAETDGHFQTVFRPAGGKFGDRQKISGPLFHHPYSGTTWASLALGPDGTTSYVWEADEPDGSQTVYGTTRRPDGTIDEPTVLSTPGTFAHAPKIAADADGNLVAVWIEADPKHDSESDPSDPLIGDVMVSHKPHDGPFGGRQRIGGPTVNTQLTVSHAGQALIVIQTGGDAPDQRVQLVFGSSITGSMSPPQRWGTQNYDGEPQQAVLYSSPRGDALLMQARMWTVHREVARKPALSSEFGPLQAVMCAPPAIYQSSIALGPEGQAAAVAQHYDYSTVIATDRESPETPTPCDPKVTFNEVFPPSDGADPAPAGAGPATSAAFRARVAPRGRLSHGRGVDLLASCSAGCTVRASGSVRIKGRRGTLGFAPKSARYKRPGVKRLKLRLSKRRRAAVRRALRRGLTVRATVRVRARKASGTKSSQLIRLRLRR